MVGPDRRR